MIQFTLRNGQLVVSQHGNGYTVFNNIIQVLKDLKFRFNPNTSEWVGPWYRRGELKDLLENYDTIEDKISDEDYEKAASGIPQQFREPQRRIPDYSLLNYGPITGKSPHEDFQRISISKGINISSHAFFFGQGTGKSYIAAAIIAHRLYKYHDCNKVLFVTTNIGVRNLYHELFKFIKGLDENKVKIADKNYRNPFDDPNTDIVITSYNSFRLICNYYKKEKKITATSPRKPFLPLEKWFNGKGMLILDESHCVANPNSQQGYLMALHSSLFTYKYLFSGTPADNIEKIYNQYKILDPWLVYNLSFTQWKDKLAYLGDRFSMYSIREWKKDEVEKQNQRFLASYGEYFNTEDLIELPDFNEKKIYIKMSPNHRKIYESFIINDLKNGSQKVRDIVNRFPYMMLATDDPTLLKKHEDKFEYDLNLMLEKFNTRDLEKYNALEDIMEDLDSKEKAIVWVIHPSTAKRICERFSKYKPICIIGDTPQDERFKMVEEFKNGDSRMLVAVIQTLATSVTILEAHVSVYFERGFNFTDIAQSLNRNYRLGQDKVITRYMLIYDNSLDCLVDKNLDSKGTLVKGLCSRDFLTQEEWQKIFNFSENTQI